MRAPRLLVVFVVAALAVVAACGDNSLGLPAARYNNVVDSVSLWALDGTPLNTPSAYSISGRVAVRTDQTTGFDFAFNIAPEGVMLNAKSNPVVWSVRTATRPEMLYADGVLSGVPSNAHNETESTTLLYRAAGSPSELSPQAATTARAATTNTTSRRGARMRAGEDTGRRPSGSTHGQCLTSTHPDSTLAPLWRPSVTWSRR